MSSLCFPIIHISKLCYFCVVWKEGNINCIFNVWQMLGHKCLFHVSLGVFSKVFKYLQLLSCNNYLNLLWSRWSTFAQNLSTFIQLILLYWMHSQKHFWRLFIPNFFIHNANLQRFGLLVFSSLRILHYNIFSLKGSYM